MDAPLIYRIAEEYILLYSPVPEVTRELLPNYEPFLCSTLPEGVRPLFTFRGGVDLTSSQPTSSLKESVHEFISFPRGGFAWR